MWHDLDKKSLNATQLGIGKEDESKVISKKFDKQMPYFGTDKYFWDGALPNIIPSL